MGVIGNGARVTAKTENQNMVENSPPYPKNERLNMTKTERSTTSAEAAEILQSAMHYCLKAGIKIMAYTDNGTLYMAFRGLNMLEDGEEKKIVPLAAGQDGGAEWQ